MKLVPLAHDNVRFAADGHVCLDNVDRHGYVALAPMDPGNFEVRLTATHDDIWDDKAGSYCLGIVHRDDVRQLRPSPSAAEWDELGGMYEGVRLCALSTGSFRLSDRLFDAYAWSLFRGSLREGHMLVMNFSGGQLRYRLGTEPGFTDVTSYAQCLTAARPGAQSPSAASQGGSTRADKDDAKDQSSFVPILFLFSRYERAGAGWDESFSGIASMGVRVQCGAPPKDVVCRTLTRLWSDTRFTDCSIECSGECFKAHRAVLCAASPVFEAAFGGEMQEAREARFEVRDCSSPAAVRALLEYVYKDTLADAEVDVLIALLPLAFLYEIEGLGTIVAERLVDRINIQNVCAIVKALRTFKEHHSMTGILALVSCLLKSDDALLLAVLAD